MRLDKKLGVRVKIKKFVWGGVLFHFFRGNVAYSTPYPPKLMYVSINDGTKE